MIEFAYKLSLNISSQVFCPKEKAESSVFLLEGYEWNKLLNFTGKDGNHILKK